MNTNHKKGEIVMAEKLYLRNLMNPSSTTVVSTFRISGSNFNGGSHSITNCIDVASSTSTPYSFYAPVAMKCVEISGTANTAFFESVDDVEFANGQVGKLCMTFAHANTLQVQVGFQYYRGAKIYEEGTAGGVSKHAHIRVGKGLFKSSRLSNSGIGPGDYLSAQYDINTENGPMTFSDAFYKDEMTINYTADEMKKRFKWRLTTSTRTNNEIWLNAKYAPFSIRKSPPATNGVSGSELVNVALGGRARIVNFLPNFEADTYQWAFVDYNNGQFYGYVKLNFLNAQTLSRTTWSPDIYLQATNSSFRVRPDINTITGSILVTTGLKAKIVGFMTDKHTDNYQWARTSYQTISNGYSQLDTNNYYTVDYTDATDSAV